MEKWRYECYDSSLLDDDFLISLYNQKTREIYARIISLDINELPVDRIEGKVTGGSINVDGDSAVRRSCSLTLVTENIDINEFYWGIKTKFKLEIGLKNNLTGEYEPDGKFYPDIIWFKGGTYLITNFNTSISTNNCNISLQGKDKMCLLNGDLSGQLFASIDFGTEEYQEKTLTQVNPEHVDSESLMMQEYYYEISDADNIIYQINNSYSFVQNSNGTYWKNGNRYEKIGEIDKIPKYQAYKLIEEPEELFEELVIEANQDIAQQQPFRKKINQENCHYFIPITSLPQSIDFTLYKLKKLYTIDYEYSIQKIPLEKIIREAVHTYAKEPYHNIIINDLDSYGLEQLSYRGDKTLYALRDYETKHFAQVTLNENNLNLPENFSFDHLVDEVTSEQQQPSTIRLTIKGVSRTYTIAKIEFGDDLGYRITDLTYTGDLISSIGESLTSILDKIKTMLGNFEYFYDVDGRFIFQEKKNYINTAWSQIIDNGDETYTTYSSDPENKKIAFNFEGNILLTAINNTPVLNNVKNDYSVWGKRKGISGADIPIHARYAIDKKPVYYRAFDGKDYINKDSKMDSIIKFEINKDLRPSSFMPIRLERNSNSSNLGSIYEGELCKLLDKKGNWIQIQSYGEESFGIIGWIFFNYLENIEHVDLKKINFLKETNADNTINFKEQGTPIRRESNTNSDILSWIKEEEYFYVIKTLNSQWAYILTQSTPKIAGWIYYKNFIDLDTRTILKVDWRELIYQMAKDYFLGQGCSETSPIYDNYGNLVLNNPDHFLYEVGQRNSEYYPTGITGYEQYYTDMEGFWRQLYNPDYIPQLVYTKGGYENSVEKIGNSNFYNTVKNWNNTYVSDIIIDYYFDEDLAEKAGINTKIQETNQSIKDFYNKYKRTQDSNQLYWNTAVFEAPETLNFWIEFLDSDSELAQFSIPVIGDRSKTVNEDKAGAIFFKQIPDLILVDRDNPEKAFEMRKAILEQSGYTFIYLPKGFSQYLSISYRSMSVKNKIDQLLYQFGYCAENISITSLPIYNLQPNRRIYVQDEKTKINGEYIVTKLTIPLTYNGTMSITANKAPERLY